MPDGDFKALIEYSPFFGSVLDISGAYHLSEVRIMVRRFNA